MAGIFIAVFYDGLAVPGALPLASGTWLIVLYPGISERQLAGMALLFAVEFIEGSIVTRLYFCGCGIWCARWLLSGGRPELARARAEQLHRSSTSSTSRFCW